MCVQDYGYWYKNGVLAPRLASGLIAVDRATKANGCLQVLKGSHHYGRIEHGVSGGQTGADMDYVEAIASQCEKVHIECQPGDVLLFPLQPAARLRAQHVGPPALVAHMLLQCALQRPHSQVAPPQLPQAGEGGRWGGGEGGQGVDGEEGARRARGG